MKKWKLKKSEIVFSEKYFGEVIQDRVELPNGKEIDWLYLKKPDSAMVIGITDDKKIIINKQYRYLVGREVFDFPAGYSEKGESIEKAAIREFEEESGYKCKAISKLGSVYETYGELDHQIYIFWAKGLTKSHQNLEQPEQIEVVSMDLEKAVKLVLGNKIPDATSALAILLLNERIRRGEIKL